MNGLQLSLIAIALALLAGYIFYTLWVWSRSRHETSSVLKPESQQQPSASNLVELSNNPAQDDDLASALSQSSLAERIAAVWLANNVQIDPRFDAVFEIQSSEALDLNALLLQLGQSLLNWPLAFEAKNENGVWCLLRKEESGSELRLATPILRRGRAIEAKAWANWLDAVHQLFVGHSLQYFAPDSEALAKQSEHWAQIRQQYSVALSLNLIARNGGWTPEEVAQRLTADGLVLNLQGTAFLYLDKQGAPIFEVQFGQTHFLRDNPKRRSGKALSLILNVPVADEEVSPFRQLCHYARNLSQALDAQCVDDIGHPMDESALRRVEKQLIQLYEELDRLGVPAGSKAALRVFQQ